MAFLVVGEALVDLISETGSWRFEAAPGGSPLNVAVGLGAAGHEVRLAAEIGDDLFGGFIRAHLARYRVDRRDLRVTAAPTSLAFARLDDDGVASYDFRLQWTWPGGVSLDGITCLHTGSLATALAPGADAVAATMAAARRRGVTVSYDPNIRPSLLGDPPAVRARVEELVATADIVKVSAEDLAWLYPDGSDLAAAARWAKAGPWLVVVTRGGAGAVALHAGDVIECAAPKVPVVDTVGAGDTFTAWLLSRLADGPAGAAGAPPGASSTVATAPVGAARPSRRQVVDALRHATAAASAVCARRGADPPTASAVAALLPEARVNG